MRCRACRSSCLSCGSTLWAIRLTVVSWPASGTTLGPASQHLRGYVGQPVRFETVASIAFARCVKKPSCFLKIYRLMNIKRVLSWGSGSSAQIHKLYRLPLRFDRRNHGGCRGRSPTCCCLTSRCRCPTSAASGTARFGFNCYNPYCRLGRPLVRV